MNYKIKDDNEIKIARKELINCFKFIIAKDEQKIFISNYLF